MKYVFTFLCLLSLTICKAQNMELHELKSFIERPAITVTDSLTKAGWLVNNELSGTKADQMYQTLSFGNLDNDKGKALAWFRIHADKGIINQLYYQSPGPDQFNLLLEEIKGSGAEKKEVEDPSQKQPAIYYVASDYIYQPITGTNSFTLMVMANKAP